jgi:periplasmic protein TonB
MLVLAEQNRVFGYAAAASLALHAWLLAMNAPVLREPPSAPPEPPLLARIAEPAAPVVKEESQASRSPPPKPVAKPKPRPKARPLPRAASPVVPRAAPAQPVEPQAKAVEEPPLRDGMEHPLPAPPQPGAPEPPVAVAAPPAAAPVPDPAAALARFREQLVALAIRYKRYPRVALDNAWTGDVVVHIDVAASGAVAAVTVKTSSGHAVLDEQAIEMFRKAAPDVAVPAALHGRPFSIEVRAIYNLRDRPG